MSSGQPFNPTAESQHKRLDSAVITLRDAQSEYAVVRCARHVASLRLERWNE
jgi:hypothetical protein